MTQTENILFAYLKMFPFCLFLQNYKNRLKQSTGTRWIDIWRLNRHGNTQKSFTAMKNVSIVNRDFLIALKSF